MPAVIDNSEHHAWFIMEVAHFLSATEALTLAACCSSFRRLRLREIMPENWEVSISRTNPSHIYHAYFWQCLPIPQNSHTAFIRLLWNDQGWGNRKGMISIVDDTLAPAHAPGDAEKRPSCVVAKAEPAPHDEQPLKLAFRPKNEKSYSIWYRVGGGGGHSLTISGCHLFVLEMCPLGIPR